MTEARELRRQQARAWEQFRKRCTPEQDAKVTALINDGKTVPEILEHFKQPTAMVDAATSWDRAVDATNRRNGLA
jgi:hypothetical protein